MRHSLLLFFCMILLSSETYSQQNLQLTRLDNSCDTFVVETWVSFSFGYQSTCPQLSNFVIGANSDTMELKLFYNISGAWPQVSCERIDTITSVILPNMTVLKGVAYSINYNDTIIESTTQIPICSLTGIESIDNGSYFKLFPNPFSTQINFQFTDILQAKIILYDFLGQQILQKTFTNSTTINTEQLANGVYFYELLNDKRIVRTGKVVKQ